jgi:chitin-binding protein
VTGLAPDTSYRPVFTLSNSSLGPVPLAPVRTLPITTTTTTTTTTAGAKSCTATWNTLSAWSGGFFGEVTVLNTSASTSTAWQVGWTWSGSGRISSAYNVTLGGSSASPTLSSLSWNGALQPGRSTTVQLLGTVTGTLTPPVISCTLS